MNIDRIARAMTGWRGESRPATGPRADFTAHVMAPIYGRPRPGFTARVVAQAFRPADAPTVGRGFSPGFRRAYVFVPAALAIAAGVTLWRGDTIVMPPAPEAPQIAAAIDNASATYRPVVQSAPPVAQAFRPANRLAQPPEGAPLSEPAPIYMIDALEALPAIAMTSIGPVSVAVPPLAGPAPLTVPELRESKEKS